MKISHRRLTLGKKITFSALTTTLLFGLINLAVWPFLPTQSVFWDNPLMMMYPVDQFDPVVTLEQLHQRTDAGRPVRYVPDPVRWYRLEPEPEIPPTGRLILHFGDSSTWGWGLADRSQAYPGVLQQQLGSDTHSVNLGVPGYSSLQCRRYLESLLPTIRDRVAGISLYVGNNDATVNRGPDAERLAAWASPVWLESLPLIRLLRLGYDRWLTDADDAKVPRVNSREFADHLWAMIQLAKSYGIRVVLIDPPVHYSWPPAQVTHTLSLAPRVRSLWVREELEIARREYDQGKGWLGVDSIRSGASFMAAIDHDWVLPRIKGEWQTEILRANLHFKLPYISTPHVEFEQEYPYAFTDYCHPSARSHQQIADAIRRAFRW